MFSGYVCSLSLLRQSLQFWLLSRGMFSTESLSCGCLSEKQCGWLWAIVSEPGIRKPASFWSWLLTGCVNLGKNWNSINSFSLSVNDGVEQIISRFQNAELPLWCHQPFTSFWHYWLERGLLLHAFVCLASPLCHCCMMLFTERWHPCIIIALHFGGALPSSFPTSCKFYSIHLLISGPQDHFYKKPMQPKELVQFFFLY